MHKVKEIVSIIKGLLGKLSQKIKPCLPYIYKVGNLLKKISPTRYLGILDWYIIKKFIGTYIYAILLIISIAIVFDFNENLSKFTQYHAPWRAIIFDYYANFIPYYSNLFSPLFVFIAVIFFTSKLAGNSEIIAMLAAGVSIKRLMRPYMLSCVVIAGLTFYLNSFVIPHGTVIRQNFETLYRNSKKNTSAEDIQLFVAKNTTAYIQNYDDQYKRGYGFSLVKIKNKKIVSHLTAMEIQYDTIADSKYHWKLSNWKIRTLKGLKEHIQSGATKDTVLLMEPTDLVYSKQTSRGSGNVVQYEVEFHKRIAMSFSSFILTIIGLTLSSRKRKGGMGLSLGIGLALSFSYIMLQTVSATFAIQDNTPPMLAAWIPNIIFAIVAYFCYRHAPS